TSLQNKYREHFLSIAREFKQSKLAVKSDYPVKHPQIPMITETIVNNTEAILKEARSGLNIVVQGTVFVKDVSSMPGLPLYMIRPSCTVPHVL
ncbi:uncharacterized protein N7443_000312, partial [Penicillium atrosanguineum]|uniref:uncharacterized protein n=1 Tax=Penicillium atrosanguineum TaxID=1132637 RepID=UPI00239DB6D8